MKAKAIKDFSAKELDQMALDQSDVKPMPVASRREWKAAKRPGKRVRQRTNGAKANPAVESNSRIVPVSLDPLLLSEADRYARSAGISRSRLVAEALRLRMDHAGG